MKPKMLAKYLGAGLLSLALFGCHGKSDDTSRSVDTPAPAGPALTDAYLTDDRDNDVAKSEFKAEAEPIFFVFAATHARHIPIRAVWFYDATDGGSQAALAEEESTAAGDDFNGAFSHRPPPAGWKPGNYHVDIYFGTQLAHTEHFKIDPAVAALGSGMDAESTGTAAPTIQPQGVPVPNVTPIPSPTTPAMGSGGDLMGGFPRDAMGNPIIALSDRFQLHTSVVCHDVDFMVELNDEKQGDYSNPDMTADITRNFNPGINTLRISWDAPNPDRDCRIAIALRRNKRYRTLTQIRILTSSPAQGAYLVKVHVQ